MTTSMTFATFPAVGADVVRVDFPPKAAAELLVGWQQWLAAADRNTWGLVDLSVGEGQGASGGNCHVLATCPSGSRAAVAEAIKSAVGVQPNGTEVKSFTHMQLVRYLAGGSATSSPRGFVAGSDVIGIMSSGAAQAIVAAISKWPPASGRAAAIIDTLGGAVADVEPAALAFPWRRQAAVVQWYAETPNAAQVGTANNWLGTAHQVVQQFSVGSYVNYLEPNTPASRYFGSNLARLSAIRQQFDPKQVMYSGLAF